MKNFNVVIYAVVLAAAAAGCGGNKKGGGIAAQAQQCTNGYQNVPCSTPGSWPVGQNPNYPNTPGWPQPGNGIPGTPGYPGYPGQNVQCAQGQFKLRNQCVVAHDLGQACHMVGGQIYQLQGRPVCMSERPVMGYTFARAQYCSSDSYNAASRRLRISFNSTRRISGDRFVIDENYLGEGCVSYGITAQVLPNETLMVSGRVRPRNENNPWSISLKKGYTLLGSQQSGTIMNEDDENFFFVVPSHSGMNGAYPTAGGNVQPMNPAYLPAMGYNEPLVLEASIRGRNRISVRLSASSCEDGAGGSYTCY